MLCPWAVDSGVSGSLPGIRPSNGGTGPASTVVGPETGNIDGSAAASKLVAGWNVTGNLGVEIGYSRTDELGDRLFGGSWRSHAVGEHRHEHDPGHREAHGISAFRFRHRGSRALAISMLSRAPVRTLIWPLRASGVSGSR